MLSFDEKVARILYWLDSKRIAHSNPTLGIYYLYRDEVGVENVKWDACVPVSERVGTKGNFKYQKLPETKVTSVILTGGYDLIGPALKWMDSEAEARGIKTKWPLTEIYIREGDNPITELQYLVDDKEQDVH
ncbi:GyrI-like domain-containing protein [Candidatus Daviesbacteria bacterium]|nr:GyrI-like domain-containing protein [Candidatus Daviesbacteria bacterium]